MKRSNPSFVGLKPASEVSSRVKKKNRSRNTYHEALLRHELKRMGLHFRTHVAALQGQPDFVFMEALIAVFCDGDFWHGRKWSVLRRNLAKGTNGHYWCAKIASNIRRDKENTSFLRKSGWHVIRLWESEIRKNPQRVAGKLQKILGEKFLEFKIAKKLQSSGE